MKEVTTPSMKIGSFRVGAKIDYVTIAVDKKVDLPKLTGKPKWPRRFHGTVLTVHDPVRSDIDALIGAFGMARLVELEIAVDVRPVAGMTDDQCDALLRSVMVDLFARGLQPGAGEGMSSEFRAFYRRLEHGYVVRPFNYGLPRATDQQLHGFRSDPVQVKGYWKRRDHGLDLLPGKQVARVEVRLGGGGLLAHDLVVLGDLKGFRFRKKLMPYFRHIKGSKRIVRASRSRPDSIAMLQVLAGRQHADDQLHWARVGVGAFVRGGKRSSDSVRLLRDTPINNRIGQALMRLERQYRAKKFVRPVDQRIAAGPVSMRVSASFGQSSMTNQ